jgi:hypothetical protein
MGGRVLYIIQAVYTFGAEGVGLKEYSFLQEQIKTSGSKIVHLAVIRMIGGVMK